MRRAALPLRFRALVVATLVAAGVVGCGQARPSDDNYGYGWSYDELSASGLRLRYEADIPPEDRASLETFETAFAEVQACVAVASAGPLIVVVPRGTLDGGSVSPPPGAHVGGLYYFDTDLIVVTDSLYALRHEMVHYLLDQAGVPADRNRAHDHLAFTSCVGPTPFAPHAGRESSEA